MGRVVATVTVENNEDRLRVDRGELSPDRVRRITVDALVASGATFLCLSGSLIRQLGLPFDRVRETRTISGVMKLNIYSGARIEIQGRTCTDEVMELPEGRQALLGQIPLEKLDWWIDVPSQRLVGNPEHGGHWMAEAY